MSAVCAATPLHRQGAVLGLAQSTQQFVVITGILADTLLSAAAGLGSIFYFVAGTSLAAIILVLSLLR